MRMQIYVPSSSPLLSTSLESCRRHLDLGEQIGLQQGRIRDVQRLLHAPISQGRCSIPL
jgi:hypothetical protein